MPTERGVVGRTKKALAFAIRILHPASYGTQSRVQISVPPVSLPYAAGEEVFFVVKKNVLLNKII